MKNQTKNTESLLAGELTSNEIVDRIFNEFENQLLDKKEMVLDFRKVTFISVYFLERLDSLVEKARELMVNIQITNVPPNIYKVFQVGRLKNVLSLCS